MLDSPPFTNLGASKTMKLSDLRQFEQFSHLSDEQLIIIKPKLKLKRCRQTGEVLLPQGYTGDLEFFLLKSCVYLTAEDGHQQEVQAGTAASRLSIARLRPSLYTITATSGTELLAISGSLLSDQVKVAILEQKNQNTFSPPAKRLYQRLQQALEDKSFTLPSLPSVALKVREVLQQEEPEIRDLDKLLTHDPSMLAKLIAAANSPLYRRGHACKTGSEAIMRLGLETTSQLVMLFSLRQLFKAKQAWVKDRMMETWSRGVRVGAIAQLLAEHHPHISGEQALVVGLIHNLGELTLLKFMDEDKKLDLGAAEGLLDELMPASGALLVSSWGFEEEIIQLIEKLNAWQHTSDQQEASLEDLIRVARLHTFIGSSQQARYPRLDEVPAFAKLASRGLTPDFSLTVIEDANDQVREVQAMFGIQSNT